MTDSTSAPILIVDDNLDHCESLQVLLEALEYPVRVIHDAPSALDYLHNAGTARIILLDLNMPGMSGEDFVHELQREERFAPIPVIVLSGNVGRAPIAEVFAQLPKGVDPKVLVALLAKAWGRGRP